MATASGESRQRRQRPLALQAARGCRLERARVRAGGSGGEGAVPARHAKGFALLCLATAARSPCRKIGQARSSEELASRPEVALRMPAMARRTRRPASGTTKGDEKTVRGKVPSVLYRIVAPGEVLERENWVLPAVWTAPAGESVGAATPAARASWAGAAANSETATQAAQATRPWPGAVMARRLTEESRGSLRL